MAIIEQTFLKPGYYRVGGETREYDRAELGEYARNTRAMIGSGVSVPILPHHPAPGSEAGSPVTHLDPPDARDTLGWVLDVLQEPDGSVRHVLDVEDAAALEGIKSGRIKFTSPELAEGGYTDGLGREHGKVFRHVAFTAKPRNPIQGEFETSWDEEFERLHPRADAGKFGSGGGGSAAAPPQDKIADRVALTAGDRGDTAVVNVPVDKRGQGSLDRQIDASKRREKKEAKAKAKSKAAQSREDKALAKSLFKLHGAQLIQSTAEKHGQDPKEIAHTLDQLIKWEPAKARKLLEMEAQKSSKDSPETDVDRGPPQPAPTEAATEPWEMAKGDYVDLELRTTKSSMEGRRAKNIDEDKHREMYAEWHAKEIELAIANGKPVPAEVLAEYPELDPGGSQMKLFSLTDGSGVDTMESLTQFPQFSLDQYLGEKMPKTRRSRVSRKRGLAENVKFADDDRLKKPYNGNGEDDLAEAVADNDGGEEDVSPGDEAPPSEIPDEPTESLDLSAQQKIGERVLADLEKAGIAPPEGVDPVSDPVSFLAQLCSALRQRAMDEAKSEEDANDDDDPLNVSEEGNVAQFSDHPDPTVRALAEQVEAHTRVIRHNRRERGVAVMRSKIQGLRLPPRLKRELLAEAATVQFSEKGTPTKDVLAKGQQFAKHIPDHLAFDEEPVEAEHPDGTEYFKKSQSGNHASQETAVAIADEIHDMGYHGPKSVTMTSELAGTHPGQPGKPAGQKVRTGASGPLHATVTR